MGIYDQLEFLLINLSRKYRIQLPSHPRGFEIMNKAVLLIIATIAILLAGCAATPMEPNANRIIASPNPAPKSCKYIGQVVGNQGNFFTGGYTSNRNLEEGAMNDMKNKAARLGANYIQLITNRAGNTGAMSGSNGMFSGGSAETNVTNLGNAYACPASAVGL